MILAILMKVKKNQRKNKMTKEILEDLISKKLSIVKTFESNGESFAAHRNATKWLNDQGYSIGSMERDKPIGVAKGEFYISKWSKLGYDRSKLDGAMVSSDFRDGTVIVYLAGE